MTRKSSLYDKHGCIKWEKVIVNCFWHFWAWDQINAHWIKNDWSPNWRFRTKFIKEMWELETCIMCSKEPPNIILAQWKVFRILYYKWRWYITLKAACDKGLFPTLPEKKKDWVWRLIIQSVHFLNTRKSKNSE